MLDVTVAVGGITADDEDLVRFQGSSVSLFFDHLRFEVGTDVATVFSGNLTLQSADAGGPPRNLDVVIPLTTPFFFDASTARNLPLGVAIPQIIVRRWQRR